MRPASPERLLVEYYMLVYIRQALKFAGYAVFETRASDS
jgi:hypothetical protein